MRWPAGATAAGATCSRRPGSPSTGASELKRVCPLLERETATTTLDIAPPPWVVRECRETGLVFLENPPGYDSLRSEIAWERSSAQESRRRADAEPALYALSTAA